MILLFDNYITDIPLNPQFAVKNDPIRNSCPAYKMPSKIDIAKYVLTSYSKVNWSNVIIKYKLDEPKAYESFDTYIKSLFPNAIIIHHRSENQTGFLESMALMDKMNDEWIFYAGNNDHPLIAPDLLILEQAVEKAKKHKENHNYVSVIYSHFSEFINLPYAGNPFHNKYGLGTKIIDKDENTVTFMQEGGDNSGIQIVHKELFRHWFCSKDLGSIRIIRQEDVRAHVDTPNQILVMPKKEICAHFDAYPHQLDSSIEIPFNKVPPLFIPIGFFEKNIKIAYGYKDYRAGWVNINPAAKKYSFVDSKFGTDLKCTLDDIPLFWKDRISEVDKNPNRNDAILKKYQDNNIEIKNNPYKPYTFMEQLSYYYKKIKHLISRKYITLSKFTMR